MSAIDCQFSLSRGEIASLAVRTRAGTEYVELERRSPWLVVEMRQAAGTPDPRTIVWSRHETTGEVVYDSVEEEVAVAPSQDGTEVGQ